MPFNNQPLYESGEPNRIIKVSSVRRDASASAHFTGMVSFAFGYSLCVLCFSTGWGWEMATGVD